MEYATKQTAAKDADMYECDDDAGEGPAFLKDGKDLSTRQNVRRPQPAKMDAKVDDMIFM